VGAESLRKLIRDIDAAWDKLTPEEFDRLETWADETLR
jgi:hypothetical protein